MGGLLFVSQGILDTWAGQGKIDFSGNVMTILAGAGQGRSYTLEPAVRFLRVVGGDPDPNRLLHKVKGESQLKDLGAEVMSDAVILGDVGYEVESGFMAETAALQAVAASKPDPASAAPAPQPPAAASEPPARPPARGPAVDGAAPLTVPAAPPAQGSPQALEDRRKEAEALARFLLENLS